MLILLMVFLMDIGKTTYAYSGSVNDLEQKYYNEMIQTAAGNKNTLCSVPTRTQAFVCYKLFQLPRYRLTMRIHLNKMAYYYDTSPTETKCVNRKIFFRKLHLLTEWFPLLLPCYGQNIPIRTSSQDDDFFQSFFISTGTTSNILYVFTVDRKNGEDVLVVLDRLIIQPEKTGIVTITKDEIDREEFLTTVETRNYNVFSVESIYVRDIVYKTELYTDSLGFLKVGELLTVCLSIFSRASFEMQGYTVDRDLMTDAVLQPQENVVIFRNEAEQNGFKQFMYPCYGKHSSNEYRRSLAFHNKFHLSSGRRPNSIFVFQLVGLVNYVKLVFYIENFDFVGVRPSLSSETEEYFYFDPPSQVFTPISRVVHEEGFLPPIT